MGKQNNNDKDHRSLLKITKIQANITIDIEIINPLEKNDSLVNENAIVAIICINSLTSVIIKTQYNAWFIRSILIVKNIVITPSVNECTRSMSKKE